MIKTIRGYGDKLLLDIHATTIEDWGAGDANYIRVHLPATSENIIAMQNKGFAWVDRTIKTSISLKKCALDLDHLVRLQIVETSEYKDEIFEIAISSFADDRRFHFASRSDDSLASLILKEWVDELDKSLICFYKTNPVGFLALKEITKDKLYVHLAAVDANYRLTGAAMSLYASACRLARERSCRALEGRISTLNMAVINMYSYFGASYSEPIDIYLYEATHAA